MREAVSGRLTPGRHSGVLDALDLGVAEHQPVAALTHSGVDPLVLAVGRAE